MNETFVERLQASMTKTPVPVRPPELPTVGMGATIQWWSDRTACTVIRVSKTGSRITIQADKWERIDNNGMSDVQQYVFTPDPDGQTFTVTRTKRNRYQLAGGAAQVYFGYRSKYYDFTF